MRAKVNWFLFSSFSLGDGSTPFLTLGPRRNTPFLLCQRKNKFVVILSSISTFYTSGSCPLDDRDGRPLSFSFELEEEEEDGRLPLFFPTTRGFWGFSPPFLLEEGVAKLCSEHHPPQ